MSVEIGSLLIKAKPPLPSASAKYAKIILSCCKVKPKKSALLSASLIRATHCRKLLYIYSAPAQPKLIHSSCRRLRFRRIKRKSTHKISFHMAIRSSNQTNPAPKIYMSNRFSCCAAKKRTNNQKSWRRSQSVSDIIISKCGKSIWHRMASQC